MAVIKWADGREANTSLPMEVYSFLSKSPDEHGPRLGDTLDNNCIEVPRNYSCVFKPIDLLRNFNGFVDFICDQRSAAIWLDPKLESTQLSTRAYFEKVDEFLGSLCESLHHLIVSECGHDTSFLANCQAVKYIEFQNGLPALTDISGISKMVSLRTLVMTACNGAVQGGVPPHESLEVLILQNIAWLQLRHGVSIDAFLSNIPSNCPLLRHLVVSNVKCQTEVKGATLQDVSRRIDLFDADTVTMRVAGGSGTIGKELEQRKRVHSYISELDVAATEATLKSSTTTARDLARLAERAPDLTSLSIKNSAKILVLDGVSGLRSLASLTIEDCICIESLEALVRMEGLESVLVRNCTQISSYRFLADCPILSVLTIEMGAGGVLSQDEYVEQIMHLEIELPPACQFIHDVPECKIKEKHSGREEYFKMLDQELSSL